MSKSILRFRHIWLLCLLLLPLGSYATDEPASFELIVPNRIVAGEKFQIQFVLNNAAGKDFALPTLNGIEVLYGPATSTTSSTSIINGKMTKQRSTAFTYTLLAREEGTYTIPEATIKVGSATYRTKPKEINALPPSASQSANSGGGSNRQSEAGSQRISKDDFFVTVTPSKRSAYEQEAILLTFKLYSKHSDISIPSVKLPEFEGFIREEINTGDLQLQYENYRGENYYTVEFYQVLLFPQRSGTLTIPKGTFDISARVLVSSPGRDFFDSFFDQFQNVNITVTSPNTQIEVKPLPTPRPANFSGAVGDFKLKAEVPTSVLKTNESLRYNVEISGSGNLNLISTPKPSFPEGFEEYDPQQTNNYRATLSGMQGSRLGEYYAVPRYTGDFTIPAIEFVYFNPKTHSYETATAPAVRLHVDKGEGGENAPAAVTGYSGQSEVKYIGQDIRYLKGRGMKQPFTKPDFVQYALLYLLGLMLGGGLYFAYRKQLANRADTAHNRRKRAGKMVRKHLKAASRLRSTGDVTAYYEELLRGLNNYLGAKFHIPQSTLSKETIQKRMEDAGVPKPLVVETLQLLEELEMTRFTPMGASEQKELLYDKASSLIENIQKVKIKL
ncbi:MAG: BatD family protein [Porphyromonas sp.]|nr:BatD family protein [Porphyromonas sp.]